MHKEQKMKLVVNNTTKTQRKTVSSSTTNPIYGRYLEFTNSKTKKKMGIREFLNELF